MSQVTKEQTAANSGDVLEALIEAGVPTANSARVLAAQSAAETAGWHAMWNWNLGNITASSPDTQPWVQQTTEGPAAPLKFLAFDTLQDGANFFVAWLSKRDLLKYANVGDLSGYVAALQRIHYCYGLSAEEYYVRIAPWFKRLGGALPVPSTGKAVAYGALILGGGLLAIGSIAYAADHGYFKGLRRFTHE
jgi:hypothetical protein